MTAEAGEGAGQKRAANRPARVPYLPLMGWVWTIYSLLLVMILGVAAFQRFRLPQTPIVDDDVWGYLHPAFSRLQGGPFQHTQGRNFLYPAFLWVVLSVFGDYRFISGCQHVLGLATGALLAAAWNILCALMPASRRARWGARFFGLLLVADFSWSQVSLLFEHTIRPESVFPLFLTLNFLLNFGALHAGFVKPKGRVERWCLGANFFVVVALQALKPSFGFSVIVANLPLLYWLTRRAVSWRAKLATTGAAVAAAGLLLVLPEQVLKQGDVGSITFLPATLFTIHAATIHEQIAADLRNGHTAPYDATWLRGFDENLANALAASAQPENRPWNTLGINADYLMYQEPVWRGFFPRKQPSERIAFCFYYYRRAWLHRPGEMLAKIGRQLGTVYPLHFDTALGQGLHINRGRKHWLQWFIHGQLPTVFARRTGEPLSRGYQQSWTSCLSGNFYQQMAAAPPSQRYLQALAALRTTDQQTGEPSWVFYLNDLTSKARLPLLLVSLLAGAVVLGRVGRKSVPLLVGAGLVFAVNFGMFLTVGVVHSLDIGRYVDTQLLGTQWSGFATVLLVWQATRSKGKARTGSKEEGSAMETVVG